MDYSTMGQRSWQKFEKQHGKRKARKLMAEKGNKGWLAIVAKFDGDEDAAKMYVSALARAIFFRDTRPIFAHGLIKPYFDVFPTLRNKFTGEKLQ